MYSCVDEQANDPACVGVAVTVAAATANASKMLNLGKNSLIRELFGEPLKILNEYPSNSTYAPKRPELE